VRSAVVGEADPSGENSTRRTDIIYRAAEQPRVPQESHLR